MNITDTNSDIRQTLTGIVSGGVGCGLNVPGWYTKVNKSYSKGSLYQGEFIFEGFYILTLGQLHH